MQLEHVFLQESWVLGVEFDEGRVCFVLDAVLEPDNERFYWPPKPGERYPYARVRWCFLGEVWWNDGPHLDKPSFDATGELDFGNVDAWFQTGDVDHVEGSFGSVAIRGARQTVEYLAE